MFIFSVSSIFIFAILFLRKQVKNGKLYFVMLSGIVLCLYSALRGHDLQPDIPSYVVFYERYARYSFSEILKVFTAEIRDPSYYFTAWLFSRFFTDAQWWLAFVGALYVICVMNVIYKESENPLLSILMLLSLGYFSFVLSGLRQSIAISIILIAYLYIKKSKPIKFIVLVLIASMFHFSAIFFLIAYPVARIKLGIGHLVIFSILVISFIGFQSSIRNLLESVIGDSQYGGYVDSQTTLNFVGFVIQVCMFVFNAYYYKKVIKTNENAKILYNLVFVGLSLQLFSSMIAEIFRLSYYFSFANILLVPLSIKSEPNKKMRNVLTIVIVMMFLIFMFRDGAPRYTFFWW